jgi:hypothetical protein
MANQNYSTYYIRPSAIQYNNYVSSQTIGPLSSAQTPNVSGIKNLGTLNGIRPSPPQFYPADGSSEYSNARAQYWNTAISVKQQQIARERAINSHTNIFYSPSTQNKYSVSTHMNYITPPPSGMYTSILKSRAVGKSSYKQGLPSETPLSFKNYNRNDVKTSLQVARSGGCVAPKKKGSIYNRTCTAGGGICNIGSFTGQGY